MSTTKTTLTPEQEAARNQPRTDQELQAANRVDLQTGTTVEQGTATEEGKKAQIARELNEQEARSKANAEGFAKTQKAIEEAHKDNKAAEIAEGERKVPDAPTSGLEHNRNTPRIDKDGNKHWD